MPIRLRRLRGTASEHARSWRGRRTDRDGSRGTTHCPRTGPRRSGPVGAAARVSVSSAFSHTTTWQATSLPHKQLPNHSAAELDLAAEHAGPLRGNLPEGRGRDSQIRIRAGEAIRQIVSLAAQLELEPVLGQNGELFRQRGVDIHEVWALDAVVLQGVFAPRERRKLLELRGV